MRGRGKGGGSMQALMRQANQMQLKMKKLQEELSAKEYSATSGGDAVKVTVNGDNKVVGLVISEDVMSSGDTEMLQDLLLTATNEALAEAKKDNEEQMSQLTGGMNIPGF